MATRSFLTSSELSEAQAKFRASDPFGFSIWLGDQLEARLSRHPLWREVRPIRLGSWSRDELCLKSDVDLLFFGDEAKVKILVEDFQKEGIKIRYRVPADRQDWTVGVQAFDVLALLWARPFSKEDAPALAEQQAKIHACGARYRKQLFREMMRERRERTRRYDSIANFLEPNLKYGPGGLRDLEQGLMIGHLFEDRFKNEIEVIEKLKSYKSFFLSIRHYLHLQGAGDVLLAPIQKELADFLSLPSGQETMSRVERALSEVSFYADWMAETASRSRAQNHKVGATRIANLEDAFAALQKDRSVLMQQHVRRQKIQISDRKKIGQVLQKYFRSDMNEDFLRALFRSQLMSKVIHPLKRLQGHVQHDQYHRYSVDAHTLQAVREVLRLKKRPRRLGRLSKFVKALEPSEWEVLLWTALYHDLGKGMKGDHSKEGAEIVKRDFVEMGISLKLTSHVVWMVQNHLLLSGAAFRQNPHASSTWAELFRRGVRERRIIKLAVFTGVDILATNPEAWNEWKERLLADLAQALLSPKAGRLDELLTLAEKKKIKVGRSFVVNLDPAIMEGVPLRALLKDYQKLKHSTGRRWQRSLSPLVIRNRRGETWIRFHARSDQPGLFFSYVYQLHALGVGVQEAFAHTDPDLGVYDWFKVRTTKKPLHLASLMAGDSRRIAVVLSADVSKSSVSKKINASKKAEKARPVQFRVVEIVSQDHDSAILSFRGRDQRGALLAAARALYEAGFQIESAKVHTWGRQIDDIFKVKKGASFEESFHSMRIRIVEENSDFVVSEPVLVT